MKALLVGEAPGSKEQLLGHGFVGTSGQELIRMIGDAGLAPPLKVHCRNCHKSVVFGRCPSCGKYNPASEPEIINHWKSIRSDPGIAITNVFHERPALNSNNVELFFGTKTEDVDQSLPAYKVGSRNLYLLRKFRHYVDALIEEIRALSPNLIVLLGNTACWAVLGQTKISAIRGTVQVSPLGRCLPTYHPAAVLRGESWGLRPIIVADLKKAKIESEINYVYRRPRWITVNPTLDEIGNWARKPAPYYVCDIESGWVLYSKVELGRMTKRMRRRLASQISMVGFARGPTDALVIPFMTRETPDLSYWSLGDELKAWTWVQRVLGASVPKIFQNGMYDINRLIHYGIRPKMCREDTMLMQHSWWPELLKSLGFLGSIHSREIAWKLMSENGESIKRDD